MLVVLFLVLLAAKEDEMQILDAVASDPAGDVMLPRTGMEYLGANVSSLSDESLSLLEELDDDNDDNGLSNPAFSRDF